MPHLLILGLVGVLGWPAMAQAADQPPLDLPWWSVVPFVALLLAIAILPLAASHWWHKNRNQAIVAALFALPVAAYLGWVQMDTGQPTLSALAHELAQYVAFIILLGSLFIVAGGIVIGGDLEGKPHVNTAFLAFGAVLANAIGTTGASVLLIRPVLRINKQRNNTAHVPVFFIFTVSNLGGLLTPLGDPPLFLGFLHKVPFLWTFSLWPQWLVVNGLVLTVFFIWDTLAYRREAPRALQEDARRIRPLQVRGLVNVLFLAGIIGGVLIQGVVPGLLGEWGGAAFMLAMALASLKWTPWHLRAANGFSWGPILEVAILFAAIFVTMVPALALLTRHGKDLGVTEPWQFFWLTGLLSGFLDNAPTYLTFATMASGSADFSLLVHNQVPGLDGPSILEAISCGAVFMGAFTYIGNGPNFMVKAIADGGGMKTPSFFGYMAYSSLILVPIFALVTFLFFL